MRAATDPTERGYSWVWRHAPDPDRSRNRHFQLGCDRLGHPKFIRMRNWYYHALDTKHGRLET